MTVPVPRPVAGEATVAPASPTAAIGVGPRELIAIIALGMAMTALGIDLMLPGLDQVRLDLGLAPDSTRVSGIVTTYFLGLAVGGLVYGPLSDRFGRKPMLYAGYGVYALGALASAVTASLGWLLVSRFVWGLGAAGPRVMAVAIVRDKFQGEHMARVMSLVMAVFLLVPVVAPSLGAAAVSLSSWRWLFACCALAAGAMALWSRRLEETLAPAHRLELGFARVGRAARYVVSDRRSLGYMLAQAALYGVFTSYLASSELIFREVFAQDRAYPLIFGALALTMGTAMLVNARLVGRHGPTRVAHGALVAYVAMAGALTLVVVLADGRPHLALFVLGLGAMLCAHSLMLPNLNTIAMAPMGPVAGTASSVIGSVQVAGGALLGTLIDRAFDGTVRPISYGFVGLGGLALVLVLWAERGRLFPRAHG